MPKDKAPKGEYHYAIQALTSRLERIVQKRNKMKNADERIASIRAALDVLRMNNLPAYDSKAPLVPVTHPATDKDTGD